VHLATEVVMQTAAAAGSAGLPVSSSVSATADPSLQTPPAPPVAAPSGLVDTAVHAASIVATASGEIARTDPTTVLAAPVTKQTDERPTVIGVDVGAAVPTLTRAADTADRVLAQAPEPPPSADAPVSETLIPVTHVLTADAPAAVLPAAHTVQDVVAPVLPTTTTPSTGEPVVAPRTLAITPLTAPASRTTQTNATEPTALPSSRPQSDAAPRGAASQPLITSARAQEQVSGGPAAAPALGDPREGAQPSQRTFADGASQVMSRAAGAPGAAAIGSSGMVASATALTHRRVTPAPLTLDPTTTTLGAFRFGPSSRAVTASNAAGRADRRPGLPGPPAPGGTSPGSVGLTAGAGFSGSAPAGSWMALLIEFGAGAWALYALLLASSAWRSSSFVSLLERPG
jgi:hypothetical protein